MMARGRLVPLTILHLLLLPAGALVAWWWALPVTPSGWFLELASFFWPYTVAVTTGPGAVVGVVEARLLRRHRAAGAGFAVAASVVGLWQPLVYVTHDPADVVPVDTGDVVASVLLWGLFWVGHVTALVVSLRRARAANGVAGAVGEVSRGEAKATELNATPEPGAHGGAHWGMER